MAEFLPSEDFVDDASDYANSIISKLNRAQIKGRKAKDKIA